VTDECATGQEYTNALGWMASINSKERQETSLEEGESENILKNKF
jgi:hypothetical protein